MIPRFYCKHCGQFKNRFQVRRKTDNVYLYWYECKWCHNTVDYSRYVIEKHIAESEE